MTDVSLVQIECPVCHKLEPYPKNRDELQDRGWVAVAFVYQHRRFAYTVCSFECAGNLLRKGPPETHEADPGFRRPRLDGSGSGRLR